MCVKAPHKSNEVRVPRGLKIQSRLEVTSAPKMTAEHYGRDFKRMKRS